MKSRLMGPYLDYRLNGWHLLVCQVGTPCIIMINLMYTAPSYAHYRFFPHLPISYTTCIMSTSVFSDSHLERMYSTLFPNLMSSSIHISTLDSAELKSHELRTMVVFHYDRTLVGVQDVQTQARQLEVL